MNTQTAEIELQQLKERAAKLNATIRLREKKIREEQRKQRTRRLIEHGGLAEIAGLVSDEQSDRHILLGGLFYIAKLIKEDEQKKAEWQALGSEVLALSTNERKMRELKL